MQESVMEKAVKLDSRQGKHCLSSIVKDSPTRQMGRPAFYPWLSRAPKFVIVAESAIECLFAHLISTIVIHDQSLGRVRD